MAAAAAWDVVVVGGGHNALVAAAYLAAAGRRVAVLEARHIIGGAAVTEEVVPGFRFSRASYVYGGFQRHIVEDLGLAARGLRLLPRRPSSFTPGEGRDALSLTLGGGAAFDAAQIGQFSHRDAVAYAAYNAWLGRFAAALAPLYHAPPPDPFAVVDAAAHWRTRLANAAHLAGVAGRMAATLGRQLPELPGFLTASAASVLDRWFDSDVLKATLATDAVIGSVAPPSAAQSAFVLLHHCMSSWHAVEGGMGALTRALAAAAGAAGAHIRTGARVKRITANEDGVTGVELASGERLRAAAVVSNVEPRATLTELLEGGAAALPGDMARRLAALDVRSGVVKINVALDRLPAFHCRLPTHTDAGGGVDPASPAHLRGTVHFEHSMATLEAAAADAAAGRASARPLIEMTVPTVLDPALAPPGKHVALLFCQYAPYAPLDAATGAVGSWDDAGRRDAFADTVFAVIERFAPGFTASVVARDVLTPLDLERTFGLPRGNIFHSAMTLDQLFWNRPVPGAAQYRAPVPGLYLASAGTHPGGGVLGAAGHNAAMQLLADTGMQLGDLRRLSSGFAAAPPEAQIQAGLAASMAARSAARRPLA